MQGLVQGASEQGSSTIGHPGNAAAFAARITERWRASVESIIEAGRILIEAKAALSHGEFGAMCDIHLPFSARTAQRLMAIASDVRLKNPTIASLLPASWTTLYELTTLSDDELKSAVEGEVIAPDMSRADILSQAKATEGKAGMAGVGSDPVRESTAGTGLRVGEADADQPATSELMDVTAGETAPLPRGARAIAPSRIEPDDSLDFFPTPPWATRALFEYVLAHLERKAHCQFQRALEPACGEGHMAEVMMEYFRDVVASDVTDYGYDKMDARLDFLGGYGVRAFDWIITNPPFGDKTEAFVLKALELAGTGVAMFVRLQWLETEGRYERVFRDHPPSLISFFTERVPLHKGRWEPDGATFTAYIWLVWIKGMPPQAPFWIPPGCRERLTKPDDVKRFGKIAVPEGEAA